MLGSEGVTVLVHRVVEKMCPDFTLFSRVCTTAPYLSSAKACTISQWSLTRVHTSSDSPVSTTGASAAAWTKPSSRPHQRCGDGEVSGSDVSE